jgi:hypothetical protein
VNPLPLPPKSSIPLPDLATYRKAQGKTRRKNPSPLRSDQAGRPSPRNLAGATKIVAAMLPRANDGWVIMYCSNLFLYLHLVIDGDSNSNEAVSGLEVAKCSSRPTLSSTSGLIIKCRWRRGKRSSLCVVVYSRIQIPSYCVRRCARLVSFRGSYRWAPLLGKGKASNSYDDCREISTLSRHLPR